MAKKAEAKVEGNVLTVAFAHGEELEVNLADMSNEIKAACAMHGLKQKVCDAYSGVKTPAEALEKAKAVADALKDGNWTTRVAGESGPRVTQLALALSRATGRTVEEARDVVADLSDEQKKNLQANPKIKKAIADIQAEKAAEAAKAAAEADDGSSNIDTILAGGES